MYYRIFSQNPLQRDGIVSKELVIDVTSAEIAIALLEDKQLVELNKEKSNLKFAVGDIYLGKVRKIMPGLNAAFVNIGYERDAFLHYLDLGPQFKTFNKYLEIVEEDIKNFFDPKFFIKVLCPA